MQSIDLNCGSAGKYIIFYILLADTFCVLTSISSTCDADAGPVLLAGALAGIAAWVPTVKRLKSTQRYEYGLVCGCGLLSATGIYTTSGSGSVGLCMSEDCSVGRSLLDHPQSSLVSLSTSSCTHHGGRSYQGHLGHGPPKIQSGWATMYLAHPKLLVAEHASLVGLCTIMCI